MDFAQIKEKVVNIVSMSSGSESQNVLVPSAKKTARTNNSSVHLDNQSHHVSNPDLEYLKEVNRVVPPKDPKLLFLLMGAFADAKREAEGVEYFSARLNEFGDRLPGPLKALYLSAIGLLRAQNAASVPLLSRIGYVNETIAILNEAKKLSGGQIFVVNWISGVVRSELPDRFHQKQIALEDLRWCETNIAQAPDLGWLREVEFRLGKFALADGNNAKAQEHLQRSGYKNFDKTILLTTAISVDSRSGNTFGSRRIREIVPGKVYDVSGFDFSELYFFISVDGKQLVGIDTGTTPDSAKKAYEALRAYAPDLPVLTTIFITHSHWDHIGGQSYFRALKPTPHFYASSYYRKQINAELDAPPSIAKSMFGDRFNLDDVYDFKADTTIDGYACLEIGGTRIELIPVNGGETLDGMFIHLPQLGVLFVGDFIMPYIGAPFRSEGNLPGLLEAIDVVAEKNPRYILHGHEQLTGVFSSVEILEQMKIYISWLQQEVLKGIHRGESRSDLYHANLVPPGLLNGSADAFLPYLILREHIIDRLFQQNVGYFHADLEGLDHLDESDRSELLIEYLGLSEEHLVSAIEKIVNDGKYELAATLIQPLVVRYGRTESIGKAERLVYLKLMEKYQNTDLFKFILYSAKIAEQIPAMSNR